MSETSYRLVELMVVAASRELPDNQAVLVGTGMPLAAAALAKKTHAPNLLMCFEAGAVGPDSLPRLPLTVGEGITVERAAEAASMLGVMSMAARGLIKYGFLGGAQIDQYGNLNSTVIGDYHHPKYRFPGSGGANDIGSLCTHTIIIMKHDKQRFVKKLDFLTTPGYLTGVGARERAGLPKNSGPFRVVTTLGVMGFCPDTKKMILLKRFAGVSIGQIIEETGFELLVSDNVEEIKAPTQNELQILRESVDPNGALDMK